MLGRPLPRMASCYVPAKHIHCDCYVILPREHVEKQEMEMKWKLETEWKQNTHQNTHRFLQGLMSSVLCHYSCILLSNGYMTGFISLCFAFTLVLCFVITYLVWLTGALVASNVGI